MYEKSHSPFLPRQYIVKTKRKVRNSAIGTANQIPATPNIIGNNQKQSKIKIKPRNMVTYMAGRSLFTL